MNEKIKYIIRKFKLKKHIEGGYYSEIYRSGEKIKKKHLPKRYNGDRTFSTSIYFLLLNNDVSVFHKLNSDEILHFYDGSPLLIYLIDHTGNMEIKKLGRNVFKDEVYQILVKANQWLAMKPIRRNYYSLIGCTVSPGFEYDDLIIGKKDELIKLYPQHKRIINKLSHK